MISRVSTSPLLLVLGMSAVVLPAHAQVRAQYDFEDANVPREVNIAVDAATTASNFDVNPTAALTGSGSGPSYSSSSKSAFVRTSQTTATTLADAITNTQYSNFTITVDSGPIDLSTFSFREFMTSYNAGLEYNMAVMCSLTGFTDGDELAVVQSSTANAAGVSHQIPLIGSAFSGIATSTVVEFRIYYYDNTNVQADIYRVDDVVVSTVDPVMILDPAGSNPDLQFGSSFAAVPGGLANRTVRYTNISTINDIEINSITLSNDGGGVFALVSPAATPFTLAAGGSFDVEVSSTSTATTSGAIAGQLDIDTDEDTPENPQDKTLGISASYYPPNTQVLSNPSMDVNRSTWVAGATHITPGPASAGGQRVKGQNDIANIEPDGTGNSVPLGIEDFETVFTFAILDKAVVPRYTGFAPDGDFLDRSFQCALMANGTLIGTDGRFEDAEAADALISIAYFPDGITSGGTEGFYAFDGSLGSPTWVHVPALGTISGSIDGPDGTPDSKNFLGTSAASLTGNVVTVTTTRDHGLQVGDMVEIAGMVFVTTDPNAIFTIDSVPTSDSFTYALAGADESFDAAIGTATGDQGDGILDPNDLNDTVNVYQLRIKGTDFGTGSASYDVGITGANSNLVSATASMVNISHGTLITSATPSGIIVTSGDDATDSGNGINTGLQGFNPSFWLDDGRFYVTAQMDPSIMASPSPLVILSHNGAPVAGTVSVTNSGFSANLDVTSATFSPATGYSTTSPVFPATGITPGSSIDVDISVNTALLGSDTAGFTDLTLVNSTGVDELVPVEWSVTTDSQLVPNWDFEAAGRDQATDTDTFAVWEETSPENALDVPGLNSGSTTGAYIRRAAGNGVITNSLGADAENFRVEYYFAVKAPETEPNGADPGTRQFNALLMAGGGLGRFQINLRYLKLADGTGNFQCFEEGGPGWQSVGSLPSTTALVESIDINSDGDLDASGSTKSIYRLVLDVTGMGTAGATYDVTVFDTDDTSVIASSTGNTIYQVAALATTLPTGMVRFTTEFGDCSSFWVDDVAVSNVVAGPDVTIDSVSGGPGSFTINWTTDPGGSSVRILLSTDGMQTFSPIDTGNTSGTFSATGADAPAGRAFYRIETE